MANKLELNQSYTAEFLLDFLSGNSRQNILLASQESLSLLSVSRKQKFTVYDVRELFLHKFSDNAYVINSNGASKIYYIKPE